MDNNQLTVAALFWASAVVIGLDALKETGRKAVLLWALTALFVLFGFLVRPLWNTFPDISASMTSVVNFPPTWFILAVLAYLVIRDRWIRPANGPQHGPPAYDDSDLRAKALEADERSRAAFNLVEELEKKVAASKLVGGGGPAEKLGEEIKKVAAKLGELDDRMKRVIQDNGNVFGRLAMLDEALSQRNLADLEIKERFSNIAKRFDGIQHSLTALSYRELMLDLAKEIDDRARVLSAVLDGGKVFTADEWNVWEEEEKVWRRDVGNWSYHANFYLPNAREDIERSENDIIKKGGWTFRDDQFPTSDADPMLRSNAVFQYKTFCIAAGKWEGVRDKAHDVVRKVAFEGHTPPHWKDA